jgi:hypothetical protein
MTNNSRASNSGMVVSVRGSVVDMRFDALLPPIYSLLRAGEKNQSVIEVPAINPLLAVLPRAGFIMSANAKRLPVTRAPERT